MFTNHERTVNNLRYNVKHIIIDEISMVRADMFDYLNRLLQEVKGNTLPFGGVQIIAVGDFYQLPPVTPKEEMLELKKTGYKSPFVFHSFIFPTTFKIVELNEVLRQKGDNEFIKLLDAARVGDMNSPKLLKLLNSRVGDPGDLRIKLTPTNKQADEINYGKLRSIPGEASMFSASYYGDWPAFPVDPELKLKVGAQVMVKKNGSDRPPRFKGDFLSKVVNGTIGKVVAITQQDGMEQAEDGVTIELENGEQATIYKQRWEKKRKFKNSDGKWEEEIVASYSQIPLQLAWSISMHKSQGQSFDKVHIDPSRVFAAGQMYVALSRCRSLAGVSLESEVNARHFWADRAVLHFFEDLEEEVKV